MKILFITRKSERCGVADYGKRLFAILQPHNMDITLCETDGEIDYNGYDVALYNYHYATLHWVKKEPIKQVILFHEAHLEWEPDVVINVSSLPRPLFENYPTITNFGDTTIIGSFGFGFPDKDFPGICAMVKNEFEKAVVRLNIPFAEFGDNEGVSARKEVEKCRNVLEGTNITLLINHEYLSHSDLLAWLAGNDINIFNYQPSKGRGLSSATDYALSVKRPIGISNSEMFRHLPREICLDNISIPELIRKGIEPLKRVYEYNSNARLVERIKEILNG